MIQRITLFFSLLALSHLSFGQNKLIDSLITQLDKVKMEEKASVLNQIAQNYIPDEPEKCLLYANKALDLANQLKNTEQVGLAYQNMGVAYYKQYKFDESLTAYRKAQNLFQKANKDALLAGLNLKMGLVYAEKNSYSDAQKMFSDAFVAYQRLKDLPGMANAQNSLGSLALKQTNLDDALKYYVQSLKIRDSLRKPGDISASLSNVALVFRKMEKTDSALRYYEKALELRQKLNNPTLIANTLNDIGNVYWDVQNWEKAIEFYFRSIKIRYETGNKAEIANSFQNLGLLYSNLGSYEKAKEYYDLALAIYIDNNDERKLAALLTSLGNIEKDNKHFEEALADYKRALSYREKIGEKKDIAASLNNLGVVYGELEQSSKAISSFTDALKIRKEINDINGQITTYNDFGNFYEKSGNAGKAQTCFEEAYRLAIQNHNNYYISLCARKIAEQLIANNQLDKAIGLLNIAHDSVQRLNNPELHKRAHLAMYEYFRKIKNPEKALENYVAYNEIDDNQQKAQTTQKILSINQNLELEKRNNQIKNIEAEVKLLKQNSDFQALKLRQQKYLLVFLIFAMFMAIVTIALYYSRYKIKKKHNKQLEEQYAMIEEANQRLKENEAALVKLNATKDRYFMVIAHDIKNPLSSLLNLSQLIIEKYESLKDEEIQDFNKMIYESATNLYNLLENLLSWARSNTNRIRFNPLPMKLLPIVNNIVLLNKLSAVNKKIELTNNVPEDIEVYADLQMLTLIIRNLVSNALKFTPEGGTVTVTAVDKFSIIEISVIDTGLGISTSDAEKLFKLETHYTTQGTGNESGTGLGLILVKEFVEKNKGKISFSSEQGKGSTFTFTLPTGK
jgi:Signal transduction histidine kinase